MEYLNMVLLGVPTVFGDSDVAQTHIMVMSLVLGVLSVAGVIYTLLIQQATLQSQILLGDLQTKVFEKTLLPIISLEAEIINDSGPFLDARIHLDVKNSNAVIHSYGMKSSSDLIKHNFNHFVSHNLPISPGKYKLTDVAVMKQDIYKHQNYHWKNIPEAERDEAIMEIIFGEVYGKRKFRCEYYFELSQDDLIIKLVQYGEN